MLGEVTCHMLPHLPGVPHLHVNRPLVRTATLAFTALRPLTLKNKRLRSVMCVSEDDGDNPTN